MAYCPVNLAGIGGSCDTSLGGIVKVYITTFADDLYTYDSTTESVSGVSTAATWYEYSFKKGSSSMASTLNVDAANGVNYVSTELALQFSRMDAAKRLEMKALSTGDIAVIVKDANGKYWALGTSEPVNASAGGGETGTAKGDGNKYTITLTDDSTSYPPEVTAGAIADLNIHTGA